MSAFVVPERLLQIAALASEAVLRVDTTPAGPITVNCPPIASTTAGAGTLEINFTDTGAVGISAGDQITVMYRQCPTLTLNSVVDGSVTITLAAASIPGLGTARRQYVGTLSLANLSVTGGSGQALQVNQAQGRLGFGYRESAEQTLTFATTDSTGLTIDRFYPSSTTSRVVIKDARFSREDDFANAARRVSLQSDTTLELGTTVVPYQLRQLQEFHGALGSAPLTGQARLTGTVGGSISVQAAGNFTDTSSAQVTYQLVGSSSAGGPRAWSQISAGYLWWLPGSNTVEVRGQIPLAVRSAVPVATSTLSNPIVVTVYLTDRVTQASTQGMIAQRVDAVQPDVPLSVEWNHAMLVLRPTTPLLPGSYEFRSTQPLALESGGGPGFYYVNLRYQVAN